MKAVPVQYKACSYYDSWKWWPKKFPVLCWHCFLLHAVSQLLCSLYIVSRQDRTPLCARLTTGLWCVSGYTVARLMSKNKMKMLYRLKCLQLNHLTYLKPHAVSVAHPMDPDWCIDHVLHHNDALSSCRCYSTLHHESLQIFQHIERGFWPSLIVEGHYQMDRNCRNSEYPLVHSVFATQI